MPSRQVLSYGPRRLIRMEKAVRTAKDSRHLQQTLLRSLEGALLYEDIRFVLRAATADDVGRVLFPARYHKETRFKEGRKDKRVRRYATGVSRPTKDFRVAAAMHTRKSPRQNVEVLIEALDISRQIGDRGNSLIRLTSVEIQRAVFKQPPSPERRSWEAASQRLSRYACTESVAVLIILLREAVELGDTGSVLNLGERLYFMTLVWCSRVPIYETHLELGLYLCRYIFTLVRAEGLAMAVDPSEFRDHVDCLRDYLFHWNHFPFALRMAVVDDLFEGWNIVWDAGGRFGPLYRFGLAPPLSLVDREHASPADWETWAFRLVTKTWGWRVLRLVEPDLFPTESVRRLLKKDPSTLTQADLNDIETEEENSQVDRWRRSPLRRRARAGDFPVFDRAPFPLGATTPRKNC